MIGSVSTRPRTVLGVAALIHFLHDGFSEILYVFLPLWASEFGLSFAQVGLIRTAYTGGMSAFQMPAGFLAERWGERPLLAVGTAVTALGFITAGWATGFVSLLALLLAAGLASGVQHPLSSSLVSKAYEAGGRRAALGTYNFSGDVGKAAVAGVGLALSLVFVGGATGKFVCGLVAERVGVIRTVVLTEALTTLAILTVVASPLSLALVVLPVLGVALNGTSSVLYGTVADLVLPERRSRAYALYYTLTMIASSLSPAVYGVVSDAVGVPATLVLVAIMVLATIPMCLLLRPVVTAPASA